MIDSIKLDIYLGIVQKVAVIAGLMASAWFFILKEEGSPHVKLIITPKVMPQCVLRVDVQAENKGGQAWQVDNAIARIFKPNIERVQSTDNLKGLEISTQILALNQNLRVGEIASFGFNIKLPDDSNAPFFVVKVAIKIQEEGEEWIRVIEEAIKTGGC